jgi:hypothetical protein
MVSAQSERHLKLIHSKNSETILEVNLLVSQTPNVAAEPVRVFKKMLILLCR